MKFLCLIMILSTPWNVMALALPPAISEDLIVDTTIAVCSSDAECRNGQGCFSMRPEKDMHLSDEAKARRLREELMSKSLIINNERECGNITNSGTTFFHARCRSLNCVMSAGTNPIPKCADKKICRKADRFETPIGNAQCVAPFQFDVRQGYCDFPAGNPVVYTSAVEDSAGATLGQMTLAQRAAGIHALKTFRTMEWLFSSLGGIMDRHVNKMDCLGLLDKIRDQFLDIRKQRLAAVYKFNENFLALEKEQLLTQTVANTEAHITDQGQVTITDQGQVTTLKDGLPQNVTKGEFILNGDTLSPKLLKSRSQNVTMGEFILNGDTLSPKLLKSRLTTGYDLQFLLLRKNAIYMEYEDKMFELVGEAQKTVKLFQETMADTSWAVNENKSWKIKRSRRDGDTQFDTYDTGSGQSVASCRDQRGSSPWSDEIQDRWNYWYRVNFTKDATKNIIDDVNFKTELLLIAHKKFGNPELSESELVENWKTKGPTHGNREVLDGLYDDLYHLIDFPLPGKNLSGARPISYHDFGVKPFNHDDSTRERQFENDGDFLNQIRNRMYLSFYESHSDVHFEKNENALKQITGNSTFADIITEPELVGLGARGCTSPSAKDIKLPCSEFDYYVKEISSMALAHAWSYAVHTTWQYANYFNDPNNWRSSLFKHYEDQLGHLSIYYTALHAYRVSVAGGLGTTLLDLEDLFTDEGGVGEDNFFDGSSDSSAGTNRRPRDRPKNVKPVGFSFIRSGQSLASFSGLGLSQNNLLKGAKGSAGASIGSSTSGAAITSAARKRLADLKSKNELAIKKGLDVKKAKESFDKIIAKGNAGSGLSGSSNGGSNNAGFGKTSLPSLVNELKDDSSLTPTGEKVGGSEGVNGSAGPLTNQGNYFGGQQGGNRYGTTSGASDGTGLSEEEKDVMMANLDRTKNQYSSNENDGLFNILSKAYTRNLDKVLIRKKQIKD